MVRGCAVTVLEVTGRHESQFVFRRQLPRIIGLAGIQTLNLWARLANVGCFRHNHRHDRIVLRWQ